MTTPAPTEPATSAVLLPPAPLADPVDSTDEADSDDGPTCMKVVLNALGTTASAFARKHGFNAGTIYNLANGTRASSYDLLWNICEAEPRISAEYLLRGEGQPLRDPDAVLVATVDQLNAIRVAVIRTLDRHIQ